MEALVSAATIVDLISLRHYPQRLSYERFIRLLFAERFCAWLFVTKGVRLRLLHLRFHPALCDP